MSIEIPTSDNYHERRFELMYWRNSQFKRFLQCGASAADNTEAIRRFLAIPESERDQTPSPRTITEALLVGSYVDAALTTPDKFEAWCTEHAADVFKKATKKQQEAGVMWGEKYACFEAADIMIARFRQDPIYQQHLLAAPSQVVLVGEIGGEPWTYMADWIVTTPAGQILLLDLKTTVDFEDDWAVQLEPSSEAGMKMEKRVRVPWYDSKGYWRQLAIGRELYRQNYGVAPVCGIVAAMKPRKLQLEGGLDTWGAVGLGCWRLDNDLRCERELTEIANHMIAMKAWKAGKTPAPACGSCEWCRARTSLATELAGWSGRLYTVER